MPTVHLHLTAMPDYVVLELALVHRPYRWERLIQARWRPAEATEQKALEWAERALAKVLAERAEVGIATWHRMQQEIS